IRLDLIYRTSLYKFRVSSVSIRSQSHLLVEGPCAASPFIGILPIKGRCNNQYGLFLLSLQQGCGQDPLTLRRI
ncbi:MAG: hypothetical protein SO096_06765, partial [Prevotella sp.]|nr:hypothetical protein [Prevotella sp.]